MTHHARPLWRYRLAAAVEVLTGALALLVFLGAIVAVVVVLDAGLNAEGGR
jgi:hypothetical protein